MVEKKICPVLNRTPSRLSLKAAVRSAVPLIEVEIEISSRRPTSERNQTRHSHTIHPTWLPPASICVFVCLCVQKGLGSSLWPAWCDSFPFLLQETATWLPSALSQTPATVFRIYLTRRISNVWPSLSSLCVKVTENQRLFSLQSDEVSNYFVTDSIFFLCIFF